MVFGTLIGLWLFVALIIPSSRNKQASGTEGPTVSVIEDPEAIPVMFTVDTTIPDMNVLGLVVPSQATDSQIVALLKTLRDARLDGSLGEQLPATTPGHKLGDHAIADIFIFRISNSLNRTPSVRSHEGLMLREHSIRMPSLSKWRWNMSVGTTG